MKDEIYLEPAKNFKQFLTEKMWKSQESNSTLHGTK